MTMDDPTTYLTRDPLVPAIILAPSLVLAQEAAKEYGVAIQCALDSHALGIRVVATLAHAQAAVAALPNTTPWCVVWGATGVDAGARRVLEAFFGPAKDVSKALAVETDGIAWRSDTFARMR